MTTSPDPPVEPAFYTPQQTADRYQVALATVYEWRKHRKGPPFVKVGKHLRISADALHAWEREQHFTTDSTTERA